MGKTAHIKKRVAQHLRNKSSKKGVEMRQEIARIEFELTGSELIARLLLLRKLGSVHPKFNTSSKKGNFPYGIFIEKSGLFPHLIVAEIGKRNDIPYCSFRKIKEATTVLAKMNAEFQLNTEFNQINLDRAIASLTYPEKKVFIIEKGRERKEKSILLIENGTFSGYAYLHFTEMKKSKEYWMNKIVRFNEHIDDYATVQAYLRENETLPIKVIK
jgi:DNA polymerase-3 subunit epsilon